jgi:hypothetical protein
MDRFWCYCMRDARAQACVARAVRWVRDEDGEFDEECYRRVVGRRMAGGEWRFDPVEEGCGKKERVKKRGIGGDYLGRLRRLH